MPNRFTVDLSRMRLISSRAEETFTSSPRRINTPPPQSIRHLPLDLDIALRQACSRVVTYGPSAAQDAPPVTRKQRAVTVSETRPNDHVRASPGLDSHPVQYLASRPSHGLENSTIQNEVAATRVDQLMCGVEAEAVKTSRLRSRSTSNYAHVAMSNTPARPNLVARGSSLDTTHSTGRSDVTEDNATSTGITSAAITPARASKRASASQASIAQDKSFDSSDMLDLKEMKRKLEMHRKVREEEERKQTPPLHMLAMPTRKPVRPANHTMDSSEDVSASTPTDIKSHRRSRMALRRSVAAPDFVQQSAPSQAAAQSERQGRSTARERAASTARSLSRGVKEFFRPGSRHAQSDPHDEMPMPDRRRPSSSRRGDTHSSNTTKLGWRASVDSLVPVKVADVPTERYTTTQGPSTRPTLSTQSSQHNVDTAAVDLNRKLPPLPTLDSWFRTDDQNESKADDKSMSSGYPHVQLSNSSCADIIADTNTCKDDIISPITITAVSTDEAILSTSPWPEMSATFCPGSFDIYGPMCTPSPISESSIKGLALHGMDRNPSPPALDIDFSPVESDADDDYDFMFDDRSPTAPMTARVVHRISAGNLKPQLVHLAPPLPIKANTAQAVAKPVISKIDTRPFAAKPGISRVYTEPINVTSKPTLPRLHTGWTVPKQAMPNLVNRELCGLPPSSDTSQIFDPQRSMIEATSSAPTLSNASNHITTKPITILTTKTKKNWWKPVAKKKQHDWMSDVEQSGSKSGIILIDEVAAAPIVKY